MYNSIIKKLDQYRLKESFALLVTYIESTGNVNLLPEVEDIQQNYQLLLHYAQQDINDPKRDEILCSIRLKGYEIADYINFTENIKHGNGQLSDLYRIFRTHPARRYQDIGDDLKYINEEIAINSLLSGDGALAKQEKLEKKHEDLVDELFNTTWCSARWTTETYSEAQHLLSQSQSSFDMEVFITAITLNLLNYFDPSKFLYMVDSYCNTTNLKLKSKLIIGILLGVYYYEDRIKQYPKIMSAYNSFCSQDDLLEKINAAQGLLLISRETEKIKEKMQKDIFPKMIKSPYVKGSDLKISEIDFNEMEEKNPEWEKELDEVTKYLEEISSLQLKGADTFMATFSQLKTFSFFNKAAHWFYPFNPRVTDIAQIYNEKIGNKKSFLNSALKSMSFCNSDKYSFCLALSQLSDYTNLAKDNSNIEPVSEHDFGEILEKIESEKFTWMMKQYIQDLYRFFKLWRYRQQQHDIFSDELTLWKCESLFAYMPKNEFKKTLARHLFSDGYLKEAAEIYTYLVEQGNDTVEVNQKLGYIYQKAKCFDEAIKQYKRAEELKPDQLWNMKHLAICYKKNKQYDKALEYLIKLEKTEPDDLKIPLQIGECLASQRKYKEALGYFFKVEYLGNSSIYLLRAISWCKFMTGKYDEAIQMYKRITAVPDAEMEDWLNLGHSYLANHSIKEAVAPYRKALSCNPSRDEFVKVFNKDRELLKSQGLKDNELNIVLDII